METIQVIDKFKMLELSNKALKFTKETITTDEGLFDLLYNLYLDKMVLEESMSLERQRLIIQAKKREDQIQELRDQVEQLKKQIK